MISSPLNFCIERDCKGTTYPVWIFGKYGGRCPKCYWAKRKDPDLDQKGLVRLWIGRMLSHSSR